MPPPRPPPHRRRRPRPPWRSPLSRLPRPRPLLLPLLLLPLAAPVGGDVNLHVTTARLLLTECPDLHEHPQDVVEVWHSLSRAFLEAHALVYVDPGLALRTTVKLLETFLGSYPVAVLHLCPGSLMRYFKKAGDAAIAAGDPARCRLLMQWGTTYRVMALSKWYLRLTSNPEWSRETLPPEALNFDAEYQGAYDLALQALHETHGAKPRALQAQAYDAGRVQVLAVCLYKKGAALPEIAGKNHRLYCERHGYEYRQLREVPEGGWEQLGNLPQEPHYWKIHQTLQALEQNGGPEWVLVVDCDAFFTNASISALDVAAAYGPTALFYVAEDPAGINTGVLLFRRHEWTRGFLRRVLQTPFVQIWDQSQFFWQLLQEYRVFSLDEPVLAPEHVAPIHQAHFNAYHSGTADSWHAYGWRLGDFIIHYAGCPWDKEPCWEKMLASARVIEEQVGSG